MALLDILGMGQPTSGGAPGSALAQLLGFNTVDPSATGVAGAQQMPRGGLLGFMGIDATDPHNAGKLRMVMNGLRTQKGEAPEMFEGVEEAVSNAQTMKLRQQVAEQEAVDREAENQRRVELAKYVQSIAPANLQTLAVADPESALRIIESMQPEGAQSLMNVGGGLIFDPNTREWIRPPEDVMPSDPAVDFDDVTGIRKEIQQLPTYKNYSQALPIYNAMSEAAGRNSRASDLNLVYGLGKIMDPTSVVREGEMVMVQNTSSLPDWLVGQINALNGGASLTPETRQAIMQEAYGRMSSYDTAMQSDISQYRDLAGRYNINEADIIPNLGAFTPYQAQDAADPLGIR